MSGIDRICALPESLLIQILSYLPTKDSVKTSALSKRWKKLWRDVLGLDLTYKDFGDEQVFVRFINRFLKFKPKSPLLKFKLISSDVKVHEFKKWIGTAVSRGIRHLDVKGSNYYRYIETPDPFIDFMPLSLYTSKTLVSLKLSLSGLEDCGFVSLPCLKLMHLRRVRWVGNMTLEKLVSGCPVLEELVLLRDLNPESEGLGNEPVVTRLRSPSLKRFFVPRNGLLLNLCRLKYILEIDAPGLKYMSLKQDLYDRIVVKNLCSLCTVELDIEFIIQFGMKFDPEDLPKKNEISDFLIGVSSVRHMILSHRTLEVLGRYSKVATIPKFNNLSRLEAEIPRTLLQSLRALLESCPNLKHLILKVHGSEELGGFEVTNASRCFLSTLECFEMKEMFEWREEEEMKIASYFLENAAVLKKLILRFVDDTRPLRTASDSEIYAKLSLVTKCSPGCQIIIDYKYYK